MCEINTPPFLYDEKIIRNITGIDRSETIEKRIKKAHLANDLIKCFMMIVERRSFGPLVRLIYNILSSRPYLRFDFFLGGGLLVGIFSLRMITCYLECNLEKEKKMNHFF